MFFRIKNEIDRKLAEFIKNIDKTYSLSKISPLLAKCIKDFVLRDGKRIRPILFAIGYLGFIKKPASGFYLSALSMELLHDFLLVHDDIIDKSDTRRGKPSMHAMLNKSLAKHKNIKFNGQDLSIVAGDIIYAMAIEAFLAIKEKPERKEKALRKFIRAAVFTGSGEFIELLSGIKDLAQITKQDIYKIYDYKTSYYSFSTPLATGAFLAGADKSQINKLSGFGILLGRAFQIKDDILGMFADEKEIGKSTLTDLQEAKKTLLIWQAYKRSRKKDKALILKIFRKKNITRGDLNLIQRIIKDSGALRKCEEEINLLFLKAEKLILSCSMNSKYKHCLVEYCQKLLDL
ncbi:MAG: polyprenyl synthetase family protein [Candidatus Omnitrophica bacterium]|nr:polyprenyl synthetase family protein [Candidatus Omnitrophota bacterium]